MNATRRTILVGLVAVCLAQLAIPARMLWQREVTLRDGVAFRFRCVPVDPVDVLRGRYVDLRFDVPPVPHPPAPWSPDEQRPAILGTDRDGFARIEAVLDAGARPDSASWIPVRPVQRVEPSTERVAVEFPFDRFYMDEFDAPRAERALRGRDGEVVEAWLVVRVRDGHAVPEMLYLDGRPVTEFLAAGDAGR